jgi:hypothetical protein
MIKRLKSVSGLLISHHLRLACFLGILLVQLGNLGCPLRPGSPEETDSGIEEAGEFEEEEMELRALEVNETVIHTFKANGQWHDSPYLAYSGHMLKISPEGISNSINLQALIFMISRTPFLMNSESPFKVTNPGQISFRTLPRFMPRGFRGDIEVSISRLK